MYAASRPTFVGPTAALVGVLVAGGPGCAPPKVAEPLKAPTPAEAFAGVQCSAVRPQTEPDLMAWDPGSRASLARLRQEGLVAVRYRAEGCNVELELLPHCIGRSAKYTFLPYPEQQTKLARTAEELYAQLPLGAAKLGGKLKGEQMIRTDYVLVGTAAIPADLKIERASLTGDCARATHVISAVYLGGFQMFAGDAREISGGVSVFSLGGGGDWTQKAERLDSAGQAEACQTAAKEGKEVAQCAVPLRIGLLAIDAGSAPRGAAATPAATPGPVPGPAVPAAASLTPAAPAPATSPAPTAPQAAGPGTEGDSVKWIRELPAARESTEQENRAARSLFQEGVAAYEALDLEKARDRWLRAYLTAPLPASLLNLAVCVKRLGRLDEARALYQRVIADPRSSESVKERARSGLRELP